MSSAPLETGLVTNHCRNFSLDTWKEKKRSLKKYLMHSAVRWKLFQGQWTMIGKCSTSLSLTHIVKRGETLTSISRQYGVSILQIAAKNSDLVDIDFILEGERLNIPVPSKKFQMDSNELYDLIHDRWRSLSTIQWTHGTQEVLSKLSSYRSHIANPTNYLLVLVPLVAICIIFTIKAFQGRFMKKRKRQEPKKSPAPPSGLRASRWRTILDDHMVSDTPDTSSREDLGDPFEKDYSLTCSEEMAHDCSKLESAYLKFLSECGMSKWGYFRGGSPE